MNKFLVIVGFLGILTITLMVVFGTKISEGFVAPPAVPKCPDAYKYFNAARGESLCCKGAVDPYKHTCSATVTDDLCAFKKGVLDPRDKTKQQKLRFCADVSGRVADAASSENCTIQLPHYAKIGKCCFSGTDLDGEDCASADNREKKYCRIRGPLQAGERLCSEIRLIDDATCPTGMHKTTYQMGKREIDAYGENANRVIPICTRVDSTCIPGGTINILKQNGGVFSDKNTDTWKFSCKNWETRNIKRDLTGAFVETYP